MRTIVVCAVIIAASTFASAVESVYGWTNVKPLAAEAWDTGQGWHADMFSDQDAPPRAETSADGTAKASDG